MRSHGRNGKRKAETNFVDAYTGASELAPPPTSKDLLAIPSKLRKIMQLKTSSAKGSGTCPDADLRTGKGIESKSLKAAKKHPGFANSKSGVKSLPQQKAGVPDQPARRKSSDFATRWKKGEDQLKILVEKMDRRAKTGISAGVGERRKRYLNEKKKKKRRGKRPDADSIPALDQFDKVEFGEIVQAPPKLSFPRKAEEIKVKEKQKAEQSLLRERQRLEAIEAYRQRKEWSSRPGGHQPPMLNLADAEI